MPAQDTSLLCAFHRLEQPRRVLGCALRRARRPLQSHAQHLEGQTDAYTANREAQKGRTVRALSRSALMS